MESSATKADWQDAANTSAAVVRSWEEIVAANQGFIFGLACHLSGNTHDAEDLTQETFLKAFEHLSAFRGESSLRTWLSRIAVNAFLVRKRREQKAQAILKVVGDPKAAESPESIFIQGEFLSCVHYILSHQCKPADRIVLVMRDINGMSYEEIAEVLGISLGAVKTRIHRARKAFRDEMVDTGCSILVKGGACKCEGVPAT